MDITLTLRKTANPIYAAWNGMKDRCSNPNSLFYKNYGGRGIKVCDEWDSFDNFYNDMVSSYKKGLVLDRIDNAKGYSKENCRWTTWINSNNNTRRNRFISYKGHTHTLTEWSRILGIKLNILKNRFYCYKWSVDQCFS